MSASAIGVVHDKLVISRRAGVLSDWFAKLVPPGSADTGCWLWRRIDRFAFTVQETGHRNSGSRCAWSRPGTHIPVEIFDGTNLPFENDSFDVVLFSDVLHHTSDPVTPQREARRVARQCVLIKDHYRKGDSRGRPFTIYGLGGNSRFGVTLPYNYWTETAMATAWKEIGLQPEQND